MKYILGRMEAREVCKELGEGNHNCRPPITDDLDGHMELHLNAA
jgi:hypothetical protein